MPGRRGCSLGSLPSFPCDRRPLAFISGCLWFPHRLNIPAWELGAASAQGHGRARPAVCAFPSQRLMPNRSSHCLTVLSPLVTAALGSPPFPRRLVSSPPLQSCVWEVAGAVSFGVRKPNCMTLLVVAAHRAAGPVTKGKGRGKAEPEQPGSPSCSATRWLS